MRKKEKHYIRKYEALDYGVGTYNSRTLNKKNHYNQRDFLDYLGILEIAADQEFDLLLELETKPNKKNFSDMLGAS